MPGRSSSVQDGGSDRKDGMEKQMNIHLSALGLLSPVSSGMLTDSRSFLSYPRPARYFRRTLCAAVVATSGHFAARLGID